MIRYFEELEKAKKKRIKNYTNDEVKLIFVGNSTAGKTTLLNYLKNNEIGDKTFSTEGLELSVWRYVFQNKKRSYTFKIHLFDFGGQEYYHDTHHLFFDENSIFILVYDEEHNKHGTLPIELYYEEESSLEVDLDFFPVEYWLDAIKRLCDNHKENNYTKILSEESQEIEENRKQIKLNTWSERTLTLIVENKIDLYGINYLNSRLLKKKFPFVFDFQHIHLNKESTIFAYRREHFKNTIQEALINFPILKKVYPGLYKEVKEEIERLDRTYISNKQLTEVCSKVYKSNDLEIADSNILDIFYYLKTINILYYFSDINEKDLYTNNIIYLNFPEWLKKIYLILNRRLEKERGEISEEIILENLNNAEEAKPIVELMLKYHLIIEHPDKEDTFIAPQYLPHSVKYINFFTQTFQKTAFKLAFENNFIHKHIILCFFSEYGKEVFKREENSNAFEVEYYYWKNGIVISNDHQLVLVEFIKTENEQAILIQPQDSGNIHSEFVKKILEFLENICSNLEFKKCITIDGDNFVPIDLLEQNYEKQIPTFSINDKIFKVSNFKRFINEGKGVYFKKAFISYSSKDLNYMQRLEIHLNMLKRKFYLESWTDRRLLAGEKWDNRIKQELENADIVFFLLSPDFFANDYIWDVELKIAKELWEKGHLTIIPIVLRPCSWDLTFLQDNQLIPKPENEDDKNKYQPISKFSDEDEAWLNVTNQIIENIKSS